MSLPVLTAITGQREAPLVAALGGPGTKVRVVRRCADLADVLSAAAAGLGEAAVLSGDLGHLDREAVGRLQHCGVAVVALAGDGQEAAERLHRLGVDAVLSADAPADRLARTVEAAVREVVARRDAQGARTGAGGLLIGDPADALPLRPAPGEAHGGVPGGVRAAVPAGAESGAGQERGQVIAVWGPVGAPGRTTVAVTLAAHLAARAPTLLVDADTHGASIAQTLGLLDESAGVAAAARAANHGALSTAKLAELAPLAVPGLRVLTGLPQSRRWPELRPGALDEVWERGRELARWVVIDAGFGLETDEELMFDVAAPRRHGATLSALGTADFVVAVGAGEPVGIQRLLAGLPELAEAVPPGVGVQVVMTRVREAAVGRPGAALVSGALDRYAGVRDALLLPDERELYDAAMLAGRSIVEHAPEAASSRRLEELAVRYCELAGVPGALPEPRRDRWGRGGRR
ncbi:CpaE family protein [Spongisporangium articulatum]|uniref:CpaE family protein n=1 Tax=Spongisporangium articulatum TaxID=3362603 RepID=A0ABW8AKZ6_9ACTN